MIRLSANLGFLWAELSLPEAIHAAKRAGFLAVECHWPYNVPVVDVKQALIDTELPMIGINTKRGDISKGENGLTALPGRESDAKSAINEAVAYAAEIGCNNIHVMAGKAEQNHRTRRCFRDNLRYATHLAAAHHQTILIEPLNHFDAPGYYLSTLEAAVSIIDDVGADNLKIMFDVYHIQIMQGDITRRIKNFLPYIGHIQIAAVPDRSEPDTGEINYSEVFNIISQMDWPGYVGAEYKPRTDTDTGLGWMNRLLADTGKGM